MKCQNINDIMNNSFDKIGNLDELQRALFFCGQKNFYLKHLWKFEVPLQLKQIHYDCDMDILSRYDAIFRMKHLNILIPEEKHCLEMRQWN